MLRSLFLTLSKARWAQRSITRWKFAWRAASRFVAGETIQDAIEVAQDLNQRGILVTLDHLGENTTTREDAAATTAEIINALGEIERAQVKANVSLKLTQIGMSIDPHLCQQNLTQIVERARETGNFIRVDMEDSSLVDRTLTSYWELRRRGNTNLGVVIQSYLYRSDSDLRELITASARIRLVKGAYNENSSVAFPKKADVDASFDRLTGELIDASLGWLQTAAAGNGNGSGHYPPMAALATHDQKRIAFACEYARQHGLPNSALEFQMLYGIRRDLQTSLSQAGYPVRVYVPYGTHWYPYFMRRLAERPANVWFFISQFFHR
jgi:proline dehydrogenase